MDRYDCFTHHTISPRTSTSEIYQSLQLPEVIALVSIRRVGKTTVMYQLMDCLETDEIGQKARL